MNSDASSAARGAVRQSLGLLTGRDRVRFRLVILAQSVTSILDLGGVLLLALVAFILAAIAQGQSPSNSLAVWLNFFGLSHVSLIALASGLALAACVFFVAKTLMYTYLLRRIYRFLASKQALVASQMFEALFNKPLGFIESRSTQMTAYAIVVGTFSATGGVLGSYAVVLSDLVLLTLLAGALLWVDPLLSLLSLAFFGGIGFFIHKWLSARITEYGRAIGDTVITGTQMLQESISFFREIQVLGRKSFFVNEMSTILRVNAESRSNSLFVSQLPKIVYEVALVIGAIVVAGWQLSTKPIPLAIATLVLFMTATSRILPSMLRLTSQIMIIKHSGAQARQTYELYQELKEIRSTSKSVLTIERDESLEENLEPTVSLRSVYARYPGAPRDALVDVTLEVGAGKAVAIVGTTGAGKSTLADLILGVLPPTRGSVLVGGMRTEDVVGRWPGALGYVPQTVGLMNGTVRQNVALGIPQVEVDDREVWSALEQAHLAKFLRSHREGLDTEIGERGLMLSGGQRQRLGLARALFTRPTLLVLDEATSALDAETEAAITATLSNLTGQVTTFVVAHRLATIRSADVVVYLREGSVAAIGTFDEVRKAVPEFDNQAALLGLVSEG